MNNPKIEKLIKKLNRTSLAAGVSFLTMILALIASAGYSEMIEAERRNDPEYLAKLEKEREEAKRLREKELDLQREKLEVEKENKRLDGIREVNFNAMRKIDELIDELDGPGDYGDYTRVDVAYRILDILKQEGIDDQTRYRGLSAISSLEDSCVHSRTVDKLKELMHKVEEGLEAN